MSVDKKKQHTVEVAMFNVLSYLWEIETGEPYAMTKVRWGVTGVRLLSLHRLEHHKLVV